MSEPKGSMPGIMDGEGVADAGRRDILNAGARVAIGAAMPALMATANAQAQPSHVGAKTLINASHPYPDRSVEPGVRLRR
ncbi:hypothetical protein G6F31_014936 [Rhizopus arrhizus]|nr:hypothetical protein G6F31_014936 [Rhizopus arrhizus]